MRITSPVELCYYQVFLGRDPEFYARDFCHSAPTETLVSKFVILLYDTVDLCAVFVIDDIKHRAPRDSAGGSRGHLHNNSRQKRRPTVGHHFRRSALQYRYLWLFESR